MVVTVLETHVSKGQWEKLRDAYRVGIGRVASKTASFLVHNINDDTLWRIMTFWDDSSPAHATNRMKELLNEYQILQTCCVDAEIQVTEVNCQDCYMFCPVQNEDVLKAVPHCVQSFLFDKSSNDDWQLDHQHSTTLAAEFFARLKSTHSV
jgi:hypothetical protein